MINKLDARISKIRNERYELLTIVSDSIKNNGKIVFSDIKSISEIIDYDEKQVKKYEAIVKAQNLIISLTEEITTANSEEEIISLRKKLNYYINKVKTELKKRNMSDEYISKYSESISNLRKDIAKYIRVLKRENNILTIDNLYNDYDKLSEEDKDKFKKLLNTEMRYNHRNLNPSTPAKKEKISKAKEDVIEPPINEYNHEDIAPKSDKEPKTMLHVVDTFEEVKGEDIEYLDLRIKSYDRQYRMQTPYSYEKSFFTRLRNMLKNIPIYKRNKKNIKNMQFDSQRYYGGSDLISYIAYQSKINSIKHGLKSVFDKTYLYSEENRLLNNHEKCAEWLLDYCQKNSLRINFLTRTKIIS